jgi:hypothetical protein
MNSKGNRIVLLLVLGLAAFSSAVKELNNLRQLGLEVHEYVAQWSEKMAPAEIPPVPVKPGSCQSKHSEPSVELSWLNVAPQENEAAPVEKRTRTVKVETAKVKREHRSNVDPVQFEVRILNDHTAEQDIPAVYEFPMPATSFKFKTRKPASFRISPRDREMLRTLNRSLNLRIAS